MCTMPGNFKATAYLCNHPPVLQTISLMSLDLNVNGEELKLKLQGLVTARDQEDLIP